MDGQLRRAGYVPLDKAPVEVRSASGAVGRKLSYFRDVQGRKDGFVVSVFVTEAYVYTVEAGGAEEHFNEAMQTQVTESIKTLSFR